MKAAHLSQLREVRGHVVRALLQELPIDLPPGLVDEARVLDGYYFPTRYANGHESGSPFLHYGALQSEEAIRHAEELVEFARRYMAGSR